MSLAVALDSGSQMPEPAGPRLTGLDIQTREDERPLTRCQPMRAANVCSSSESSSTRFSGASGCSRAARSRGREDAHARAAWQLGDWPVRRGRSDGLRWSADDHDSSWDGHARRSSSTGWWFLRWWDWWRRYGVHRHGEGARLAWSGWSRSRESCARHSAPDSSSGSRHRRRRDARASRRRGV